MANIINNRNYIHWGLWGGFLVLSNIPTWWALFLKPAQRAATVSATKDLFTASDPETKKLISKYGINTKSSLQMSAIVECGYKHTNLKDTTICINTATIKYGSSFICETASMGMAPSFVTKPTCFAIGALSSTTYKTYIKGQSIHFSDLVYTSIATGTRELEHWLPQELVAYGIPFEYTFYITTFIEGTASTAYTYITKSDAEPLIKKTGIHPDQCHILPKEQKETKYQTSTAPTVKEHYSHNDTNDKDLFYSNEECSALYSHESDNNIEEKTSNSSRLYSYNSSNTEECTGACDYIM